MDIDNKLKQLTRKVKERSKTIEGSDYKSHPLEELKARNEKIIKASELQYKQPFQYNKNFNVQTKERLIESYEQFLDSQASSLTKVKKIAKKTANTMNKKYGTSKTPQEWSQLIYAVDERKDLSNILDMIGSGRKFALISEMNTKNVNDILDRIQYYLDNNRTDWDLLDIEKIVRDIQ